MTGTIAVVLVFGGLIFFHELGHFAVARLFGMGVKTFSLGFGPVLLSFKGAKTRYQVAALPLGGFVSLVGERGGAELPEGFTEQESFALRPAWQRFMVILAGPVCNLLLAWFICWGLLWSGGRDFRPPVVGEISEDSPAMHSPLQAGDRILRIGGVEVTRWGEIGPLVQRSAGKEVVVTAQRPDGSSLIFSIAPALHKETTPEGQAFEVWVMGIRPGEVEHQEFGFFPAAYEGLLDARNMVSFIWRALGDLVTGAVAFDNVGGPILIAQTIHSQADSGLVSVLMIAAIISVNLGMLNLLPVPVLDGGHLVFLTVEMAAGRPVPQAMQEKAMFFGLFLLLALMVAATYNDIMRFFT